MKFKAYLGILLSHLTVLTVLFTPIIRMSEIVIDVSGEKVTNIYFVNLIDFIRGQGDSTTSVIMVALTAGHVLGIANAVFGLIKKEHNHIVINSAFALSFSSALMGALLLYSKSYALFFLCAVSFLVISFCSIKLIKAEQ